jgi:hypothetical protein
MSMTPRRGMMVTGTGSKIFDFEYKKATLQSIFNTPSLRDSKQQWETFCQLFSRRTSYLNATYQISQERYANLLVYHVFKALNGLADYPRYWRKLWNRIRNGKAAACQECQSLSGCTLRGESRQSNQ